MNSSIYSQMTQVQFMYSLTLTFIFKVTTFGILLILRAARMVRDKANITIAVRYEVRYYPSNSATVNVVYCEIDLHFHAKCSL